MTAVTFVAPPVWQCPLLTTLLARWPKHSTPRWNDWVQNLQSRAEELRPGALWHRRLILTTWCLRVAVPTFLQLVPSRRRHAHNLLDIPLFQSWPEMVCSAELSATYRAATSMSTTRKANGQVERDPLDKADIDVDHRDVILRELLDASGLQAVHQALLTGPLSDGERKFIDMVNHCAMFAADAAGVTVHGYENDQGEDTVAAAAIRDSAMAWVPVLIGM